MRRFRLLIPVALLAYLLTGVVSVRPGEQAVVRRFGAVVAKPGPGLWVGLPWGIDRVDRVPMDLVRRVTVGYTPEGEDESALPPGQLLTGDQNLVNVRAVIDYAVHPDEAERYVAQRERVDGAVSRAAEAVLAEWVAGQTVDDVLLTGKAVLPTVLVARLRERLGPYRLGIEVQAAGVAHLAPPEEVTDAFAAVTRAQAGIRTREQEASQEAERLLRQARTKAYSLEQSAAAVAHERRELARTDAEGFRKRLEQYRRLRHGNAGVLAALWWDEMGGLFARMQSAGRLDLLDQYLGADGLDIMQFGPRSKKK
jgi:membrane protease subunit HflK